MNRFDLLPCPVLVTDAKGYIQIVNEDLVKQVGGTRQGWVGQFMDGLFPLPSRIFLQTHVWPMLMREGGVQEVYLSLLGAQGQPVPVMINAHKGVFEGEECVTWAIFVALERSRFESELMQARAQAQRLAAELAVSHAELKSLHQQLAEYTQEVETENRDLSELSQTDVLTGLGNRRALEKAVNHWTAHAPPQASAALLMVDVDHFKRVNDTGGHDEGDRVLRALADQMRASLRQSDVAVRYGGEEFVVWLPNTTQEGGVLSAQRLHDHVRAIQSQGQAVTISVGLASGTPAGKPDFLAQLLRDADRALYEAKGAGRNQTVVWTADGVMPISSTESS